jgi:branched-chain amino acid transport system substrate-binding protein
VTRAPASPRCGRSYIAIALTVVLALAAAGCGSDDNNDSGSSGSERVVKIGVIAPIDAGLTSFGRGIRNSVQLAVDEANARAAIQGWRIDVEARDDSSDPATGKAAAEALAADPAVIGVVGTYNSGVAAEAAPILGDRGIAMISPANTDPALTRGPDRAHPARQFPTYFRMVATDAQQGPFLARYARGPVHAQRVAIVSETKPVSRGLADDFSRAFRQAGGTVVYDKTVPDGTTDFDAIVQAITPLEPDLVFFGGEYQVAAGLRSAATAVDAPLMGGDGIKDDAYIEAAGARANGDIASTVGAPVATSKSAATFLRHYDAANFDDPPTDYGPYAYDAANLLIAAAAAALQDRQSVTDDVRGDVVQRVGAARIEGSSGPVAFDRFGDTVTKVLTIYRVEQGKWTPVLTGS